MLDATVAGPTANSYLTIAAADALAADRIGPDYDGWVAADDADKARALISATEQVDAYRGSASVPYSTTQALVFPREVDLVDALPVIPGRITMATFEQGIYLMANSPALADSAARRARGLISFSDDDGGGSQAVDPTWGLMAPKAVAHLAAVAGFSRPRIVSVPLVSSFPP